MAFILRTLTKINASSFLRQQYFNKSTLVQLNRSLVKISGDETVNFLQGLVTNDVRHLLNSGGTSVTLPCIYTLILNLEGRVLYDALLYAAPESNAKEVWLECDTGVTQDVIKLLKKYRVRKKIDISALEELSVWANLSSSEDSSVKNEAALYIKDPRLKDLGYRTIFDMNKSIENCDSINLYTKLRYELGIGEGVDDHPPANCFPLEINGDYLHGVSFHKGCYVGQELTSRVHHTGVVRKRYMPIILNQPPVSVIAAGRAIKNEKGRSVGKFRSSLQETGLALLRIEEALNAKDLRIEEHGPVTTFVPDWWPKKSPSK